MKEIKLDMGLQAYRLGAGVLRFNPADPNLYDRFRQATEKLQDMQKELQEDTDTIGQLVRLDGQIKQLLGWVFGPGNDFDKMLEGVNLLSITESGKTVIEGLLAALEPVLSSGAKRCVGEVCAQAVAKAKCRRERLS